MFHFGYVNRFYPTEVFHSTEEQRSVAADPATDGDILFRLAYSADPVVWDRLMTNPSVSPSVVFVLMYGDDTLYENPRELTLEQREQLFYLMDCFALDCRDDREGFREKWGDVGVECVEVFRVEEGMEYEGWES